MSTIFRPAILILFTLTAVTGIAYPLAVTGFAQLFFPVKANGSIIRCDATTVGSTLIGQAFDRPNYLWGRPSATSPDPYNAGASTGSNFGPMNPALRQRINERAMKLRSADPGNTKTIPVDLVTSSGSGLDPHISVEAAFYQEARIARVRGIAVNKVRSVIDRCTLGRQFGVLGEPRVNVVCVNLALDGNAWVRGD